MAIDRAALTAEGQGLYRFALSMTRDPHAAADLVQDTYVRALERESQYDPTAPAGPWLRRILHNLAVDRARRSAHEVVVEDVEDMWRDDEYTIDPSVIAENAQTREELEDALARIPFVYRAVVVLHDVDGWKIREIAQMQSAGVPAVKQRLRRGRMALTTALASGAERRKNMEGVPMRCWDARQHISDYLDERLDPDTKHLVESHLEVCPTCPPLYASLVDAHDRLSALRDPNSVIPPDLDQRIKVALHGA